MTNDVSGDRLLTKHCPTGKSMAIVINLFNNKAEVEILFRSMLKV